jgi:hypothetical protein
MAVHNKEKNGRLASILPEFFYFAKCEIFN